jgi:hypothetical protein
MRDTQSLEGSEDFSKRTELALFSVVFCNGLWRSVAFTVYTHTQKASATIKRGQRWSPR